MENDASGNAEAILEKYLHCYKQN